MPSPLQDLFGVNELQSESPLLSFPSNLGSKNVQHYIMFTIKPTAPSNLELDFMSSAGEVMSKIEAQGSNANAQNQFGGIGSGGSGTTLFKAGELGSGGNITRPTGKKEYVALYLPSVITNNQSAKYNDVEMGNVVSLLSRGLNTNNLADLAKKFVANKAKQSAGAELSSLAGAYELKAGKVTNNQIESVFETIDRRTFQFDFRMIPRNPREATNIRKIVKKFRSHMAPSIPNTGASTFMVVPSLFEIEFISKEKRNNTLPRIQESICTTCNVNYGGERISLFSDLETEDGEFHPVETTMTLTFQEIPIITKEKIEDGF
jgi:hypothetical protein